MHKYKRAAHGAAWFNEPNETTFNPFQKTWSRTSQRNIHDIEAGAPIANLGHSNTHHSEADISTLRDIRRRSQQIQDVPGVSRPFATMPQDFSPVTGGTSKDSEKEMYGDKELDDLQRGRHHDNSEDTNTGTTGISDATTIQPEAEDGSGTNQPRKRNGFLSRFHKKNDNGNGNQPADDDDPRPKQKPFTAMSQLRATLLNSYINILLIMAPIGIALNFVKGISPVAVFVVNFIAIIPLAAMLSYATEEIALRTGETIGGLLNATFGNAVELIVSILALVQNQVLIVQTSLIGSMLSNLLLVMGMCFFFGGLNRVEQYFNVTVAQTAASLLSLAVGSLVIPTAFNIWASGSNAVTATEVTALSRGVSILLLLTYGAYLFFQLKTHSDMYNEPSKKVGKRRVRAGKGDASKGLAQMGANMSAAMGGEVSQENPMQMDDKEQPQLSIGVAVFTLAASTALVAVCAEFMVDNINQLTEGPNGISKTFVGLILLPIVGNAAEHATAVTVACKDKMDLAIGVAVGSSLQIALFVLPAVVTLGWILGKDTMNLSFDGFQIAVLFVAVLLINYLIADGKSHWLEGWLMQTLYLIIAISAWYYPASGVIK
ncbi:hypothetical protein MMC11_005746 [Xylographa trunciseda]|nr:hypothetical protein [Xylographa trunciseda]